MYSPRVIEVKRAGGAWRCSWCVSLNNNNAPTCSHCGASRFTLHALPRQK